MNIKKLNKKSQVIAGPIGIIAFIIFAIVMLVFFFLFKAIGEAKQERLEGIKIGHDVNFYLLTYLKTPVEFPDKTSKTVEEIYTLFDVTDEFIRMVPYFVDETLKFFNKNIGEEKWNLMARLVKKSDIPFDIVPETVLTLFVPPNEITEFLVKLSDVEEKYKINFGREFEDLVEDDDCDARSSFILLPTQSSPESYVALTITVCTK